MINKSPTTKRLSSGKLEIKSGTKQLLVMELFAGVGGFHIGFNSVKTAKNSNRPFKVVWANQWEPRRTRQYAFKIYQKHFPDAVNHNYANVDISKYAAALNHVSPEKRADLPRHDLLCGGFPCQDYSVAKPRNNSHGIHGKKGVLWWSIYAILKKASPKPKYIVLENVDRLLKSPIKRRGRDFAVMLASLNMLGYIVEWRVIDASVYGYPQRRKRIFIVARRPGLIAEARLNSVQNISNNLTENGVLARAFPILKIDTIVSRKLYDNQKFDEAKTLHELTLRFNKKNEISPFHGAGIAYRGQYWTARVHPRKSSHPRSLGDVLQPGTKVSSEFYISQKKIPRWKKVKGPKKVWKKNRKSGIGYWYAEGAIAFPDATNNPARTIVTSEGGKTASRMKHIIKRGRKYRRLTPVELERLNGFPDGHTTGVPDTLRGFLMGNALVVGCVARIGSAIADIEGWDSHIDEPNKAIKKNVPKRKKKR